MPKFFLEKTANAKRESVCDVFSDFESYQDLLPQHFPSVRIRSVRDNVSVVEEHLNLGGKELLIMAKHVSQKPILHEVFVIGGDIKGSHIRQEFVKLDAGTKILVDVNLKFRGRMKIARMFEKDSSKHDYDCILDDFIKIAES